MIRPALAPLLASVLVMFPAGAPARAGSLELAGSLTAELSALAGGIDPGTDTRAFGELSAHWSPAGSPLALFAAAWWQRGPLLVERAGDAQFASNIDSEDMDRLAALGLSWDGAGWGLVLGKYDANSYLSTTHSNMAYMHSSLGFSPTIVALPTFPVPAVGALARVDLPAGAALRVDLQDGATPEGGDGLQASFDARFAALELELPGPAGGELAIGLWGHDGEWGDGGNIGGGWLQVDSPVAGDRAGGHLDLLLAAGVTPYDADGPQAHLALALLDHGWGPVAAGDLAGAAVSGLWLEGVGRPELALELFYEWQLSAWLYLRPALQWVHDPAFAPGREDAALAFLRATASF